MSSRDNFSKIKQVFSWEPIRCHDTVDVGWSRLSDLNVREGKLLGCSSNQSCVEIWVVDLTVRGSSPTFLALYLFSTGFYCFLVDYAQLLTKQPIGSALSHMRQVLQVALCHYKMIVVQGLT